MEWWEQAIEELKLDQLNAQIKEKCMLIIEKARKLPQDEQLKAIEDMQTLIRKYKK